MKRDFRPLRTCSPRKTQRGARKPNIGKRSAITYTGYAALELASGTLNPQSPVVTP